MTEEKEREEPLYPFSLSRAREKKEEEKWYRSRDLTLSLKEEIDKAIEKNYDPVYGKLKKGSVLPLTEKYGEERVAYVLSLTISEHLWDGRFSLDNRSWAVGVKACYKDLDDAVGFDHLLTSSRPAIDRFAGEFRDLTGFDPALFLMGSDKEPDAFLYTDSYSTAVFADELPQYLWSWGLDKKCAAEIEKLIEKGDPDGISGVISEFGAERTAFVLCSTAEVYGNRAVLSSETKEALFEFEYWVPDFTIAEQEGYRIAASPLKFRAFMEEAVPVLKRSLAVPKIREEKVLFGNTEPGAYSYAIYQIGDVRCGYRFEGREYLSENALTVDPADYRFIYSGSRKPMRSERDALDGLFYDFNVHRPADFKGRSISVSDVIVLNHDYEKRAYYIDDTGYLPLPDFVRERREFTEKQREKKEEIKEEERESVR